MTLGGCCDASVRIWLPLLVNRSLFSLLMRDYQHVAVSEVMVEMLARNPSFTSWSRNIHLLVSVWRLCGLETGYEDDIARGWWLPFWLLCPKVELGNVYDLYNVICYDVEVGDQWKEFIHFTSPVVMLLIGDQHVEHLLSCFDVVAQWGVDGLRT